MSEVGDLHLAKRKFQRGVSLIDLPLLLTGPELHTCDSDPAPKGLSKKSNNVIIQHPPSLHTPLVLDTVAQFKNT